MQNKFINKIVFLFGILCCFLWGEYKLNIT